MELPILSGLKSDYLSMKTAGTLDSNKIYITKDTSEIFFGEIQLAKDTFTLETETFDYVDTNTFSLSKVSSGIIYVNIIDDSSFEIGEYTIAADNQTITILNQLDSDDKIEVKYLSGDSAALINYVSQQQMLGVQTTLNNRIDTVSTSVSDLATVVANDYVSKSGSSMNGSLTLNGSPTTDNMAANKKYVDDTVSRLETNSLTFRGFVSTTEPTVDLREGNYWYQPSAAEDFPDVVFPWQIKTYTSGAWSTDTIEYTPLALDLWSNLDNSKGYYYFSGWNNIDYNGNAFNLTQFTIVDGIASIADGGITDAQIAANADIEQNKIKNLVTDISAKTDKVVSATAGDIATLDVNGNLTDSGVKPTDKIDKIGQFYGSSNIDPSITSFKDLVISNGGNSFGYWYDSTNIFTDLPSGLTLNQNLIINVVGAGGSTYQRYDVTLTDISTGTSYKNAILTENTDWVSTWVKVAKTTDPANSLKNLAFYDTTTDVLATASASLNAALSFFQGFNMINAPIHGTLMYVVRRHQNNSAWFSITAYTLGENNTSNMVYIGTMSDNTWGGWKKLVNEDEIIDCQSMNDTTPVPMSGLQNIDLNTYTNTFIGGVSHGCTNIPSTGVTEDFYAIFINYDGSGKISGNRKYCRQMLFGELSFKTFSRSATAVDGSAWSDWQQLEQEYKPKDNEYYALTDSDDFVAWVNSLYGLTPSAQKTVKVTCTFTANTLNIPDVPSYGGLLVCDIQWNTIGNYASIMARYDRDLIIRVGNLSGSSISWRNI